MWLRHCEHTPVLFVCSVPPSPQHDRTSEPKKVSTLTQGGEGDLLFRLTRSVVVWGVKNTANKYHWHVWGVLAVSRPHWVCPRSRRVCFPCLRCLGSRLPCRELSEASPGLHAPPRSKPLRFGYLDTLQRHRLVWAYVLCPSQVQAAQVTSVW